ncbi:MAG: hypothetical protein A2068_00800 [Ignavibacteria bacterium GWB2_35_6b]|nr:MAG: hypothetical protein A2068_00800 [Ignavibacteria bacterium GWB2_35_6b]
MKIISKIILALFLNINLFAQGYICAVGGGSEDYNDWSDAPYGWAVQKSDSAKIIILGVSSATDWLPNYFMSLGADTAYNKTIASISSANLQTTYDEIITAKAIFIRGGDQWDYFRLWKGTKVDTAINYVFQNGGVIAGTSAGAAVLGDVDFSARYGTVYPDEALLNPFNNYMQLDDSFLPLIKDVLFDTHFTERARHARLITMLYNQHFNKSKNLIGTGIDDRTAICISPDGIGEVMGSGAVTIFYKDDLTNYTTISSDKYTIENLKSEILTAGWKYDFINKEISFIPLSAKDFIVNENYHSPKTNFYLTGSDDISAQLDNNLATFLSEVDKNNIAVICHPGFANQITSITNYLAASNYIFSVINLTSANLNNADEANTATCFIIAGDSLNVLSYLNQTGNSIADAFNNSVKNEKPIFFFGNSGKISGEKYIDKTDSDEYASYRGRMTSNNGVSIFGELIFQPLIFADSDFYENRMSAALWGMMRNRKRLGIYLNGNDMLKISSADKSINGNVSTPYIIVDASETTKIDSSTYRASGSIGTRQVAAMNNLRFSLTNNSDVKYLTEERKFEGTTGINKNISDNLRDEIVLHQNYPNPFNPVTKISFAIPVVTANFAVTTLKIYDVLGREIKKLVNEYKQPGTYEIEFDASFLSSGVYFYKLQSGNFSAIRKMVLIK